MVCGLSHLGCYPTGMTWDKGMTDVVAVDSVSQAIVYLSLNYCELYSWTSNTNDISNTQLNNGHQTQI